jgi:hypothetical protein
MRYPTPYPLRGHTSFRRVSSAMTEKFDGIYEDFAYMKAVLCQVCVGDFLGFVSRWTLRSRL